MNYLGNDIYKQELDELEIYCKHKYNLDGITPKDSRFRIKCAEIWAYKKALDLCKERYWSNPDDILYELGVYFCMAQLHEKNLIAKNCFEHAYLVVKNMQLFLEKVNI